MALRWFREPRRQRWSLGRCWCCWRPRGQEWMTLAVFGGVVGGDEILVRFLWCLVGCWFFCLERICFKERMDFNDYWLACEYGWFWFSSCCFLVLSVDYWFGFGGCWDHIVVGFLGSLVVLFGLRFGGWVVWGPWGSWIYCKAWHNLWEITRIFCVRKPPNRIGNM